MRLANQRRIASDGEGFDYNTPSADYWLVEIAAFETGLSADMLRYPTMQHNHGMTRYHYRGLLVGSAFRYSGGGAFDPEAVWVRSKPLIPPACLCLLYLTGCVAGSLGQLRDREFDNAGLVGRHGAGQWHGANRVE